MADMGFSSKVLCACSSLALCLVLISCSGSPKPPADFSLSSTPATIALVPGGAGEQISVNTTPVNGFTGTVAVAISGLPTGVTAQPAMLTLSPGTTQNVTITAA